jgi:hypothetical protein
VVSLGEPERFAVRDGAQVAGLLLNDLGLLALDCAEQQALVVGEDFIAVEVVEGFRGVLAGDLGEDHGAAGVGVDEFAEVVDFVVDDDPEVFLGVVL